MSIDYLVANLTKRQYFDTFDLGGPSLRWILRGESPRGLGPLLSPEVKLGFHLSSWVGDCFFVVTDRDDCIVPQELVDLRSEPRESPYWTVKNCFANISLNLLAEMCSFRDVREEYLDLATRDGRAFFNVAHMVMYLDAPDIEAAFVHTFGTDWRKRYKEIADARQWDHPRPMLPLD